MMDAQQEYDAAAAAFRAGKAAEGAELLRHAAFAGHADAQNQLARLYFSHLAGRADVADLEAAAQGGDHVALFVLAMCFVEGKHVDKDHEKALAALRLAASKGNCMAASMLHHSA